MTLSLIVAMTKNRVIGKDNQMPWHLPVDLAWFRQNTTGKPVIMGRKTFESIGRPLPSRTNIVLSRSDFQADGVVMQKDLQSAVGFCKDLPEIMLIGGGQLFQQALPMADKLYLTEIQTELAGDTFFPEINANEWQICFEKQSIADDKNSHDCRFLILQRSK